MKKYSTIMFIAGSYMLYSSPSTFSPLAAAVPCSLPATTTSTAPSLSSVSAFTAPAIMAGLQQKRSLEAADLTHLKKLTGFSVSDILEREGSAASEQLTDGDVRKTAAAAAIGAVVTPSSPRPLRRHGQRALVVGSFSSVSASSSSPSPSSSSSSSSSGPSSPLSLCPSPTYSPHCSGTVDMPQDLSSVLAAPKPSPVAGHTRSPHFSHQLKFGVDRILSNDLSSIGRRDMSSSCTMCVSPYLHPTPQPPPPPLPLPLHSAATLRCRTSGVPCDCMHPLCDGIGLFPALYAYSSLPYPACAIYPSAHVSPEREIGSRGGAPPPPPPPPHHHQNTYHHTPHHHSSAQTNSGSGKRKRSWSRAVFSNLQRKGLEKRFQIQKYITKPDRRQLAATLGLTDAQVKVWFQNRRMKWRHSKEAKEEFAKQAVSKAAAADEQQQNNKTTNETPRKVENKDAARTKSPSIAIRINVDAK